MQKPTKKVWGEIALAGLVGGALVGGLLGIILQFIGGTFALVWIIISVQRKTVV